MTEQGLHNLGAKAWLLWSLDPLSLHGISCAYLAVDGNPAVITVYQNRALKGVNCKPRCLVLYVKIVVVY